MLSGSIFAVLGGSLPYIMLHFFKDNGV
jgi:hypothetical protein